MNFRTVVPLLVQSVAVLSTPLYAADLDVLIGKAARYESGQSAEPLRQIEQRLRESAGDPVQRPQLETALVRLLSPTATFEARRFACQQLASYGTESSLPALADLFKSPDTVGMACLALSTHPSTQASDVLRKALIASTGADRVQVMVALGERGDAPSVPTLMKLADDPDPATAAAAIAALGKIASGEALKSLSSLRQLSDPGRAGAAVMASLVAADRAAEAGSLSEASEVYEELLASSQPLHVRRAALEGLLRTDADGGQKRILDVLDGQDVLLKPSAIARIAVLTTPDASKQFARELPRLHPDDQVLLIEALAVRNDRDARTAVTEQVSAANPAVRRAAIMALADIGDASAAIVLIKALSTVGSADDQQVIATALSNLEGNEAVDESIMASLKNSLAPMRAILIEILRRRACTAAVPVLLGEAGSSEGAVAEEAFRALGQLASLDTATPLVDRLVGLRAPSARNAAETAAAKVLAKIPDPALRSTTILGPLTQAKDAETRCSLIGLLRVCGNTQALEALKTAMQDTDPSVRDAALRTLADWPDVAAWDLLAEVYRPPAALREHRLALRGLVRLGHKENNSPTTTLIDRYRELLQHARDDSELKLILSALAGCAHPDILNLVLPLRRNTQVKAEAEIAVRRIAEAIRDKHPEAAQTALQELK